MPRIYYERKAKTFDNAQCKTFDHVDSNGEPVYRSKRAFETDKEAIEVARIMNLRPQTIRKCVAYKCRTCGKWHVGRTDKTLTEKDIEHYKKMGDMYAMPTSKHFFVDTTSIKRVIVSAEQELIIKRNLGLSC